MVAKVVFVIFVVGCDPDRLAAVLTIERNCFAGIVVRMGFAADVFRPPAIIT